MRMMETAINNVIHMIAVWHRLVPAFRAVDVMIRVIEMISRGTTIGVSRSDLKRMLLDRSILILMVEVSVVNEIDVISVLHHRVAAALSVVVVVGARAWV